MLYTPLYEYEINRYNIYQYSIINVCTDATLAPSPLRIISCSILRKNQDVTPKQGLIIVCHNRLRRLLPSPRNELRYHLSLFITHLFYMSLSYLLLVAKIKLVLLGGRKK